MTEKMCNRCGETTSIDRFSKGAANWDGLQSTCKDCAAAYSAAHRAARHAAGKFQRNYILWLSRQRIWKVGYISTPRGSEITRGRYRLNARGIPTDDLQCVWTGRPGSLYLESVLGIALRDEFGLKSLYSSINNDRRRLSEWMTGEAPVDEVIRFVSETHAAALPRDISQLADDELDQRRCGLEDIRANDPDDFEQFEVHYSDVMDEVKCRGLPVA